MKLFKVVEHKSRSLLWWYEQLLSNRLDMEPSYQRKGNLWNKWKKAHLIDSILNDFDIPKLYVADFIQGESKELNESSRPYSIIDGKQRLGAIFDFFEDKFSLNESFVLDTDPELKLGGLSYSKLREKYPSVSAKFDNFSPVVMSVLTEDKHRVTEMFTRLNSGESANAAERRNAIPGPVTQSIRQVTSNRFFLHKISFNTARMQEFNLAAKLVLIEYRNGFVDTKARNLDAFAREGATYFVEGFVKRRTKLGEEEKQQLLDKYAEVEETVLYTLDRMAVEFADNDPLLSSQGHIPVYYWLMHEEPSLCKGVFRDFLDDFTSKVRQELRLSKIDPELADPELMSYYTMGRTTNDQASLTGRYKILLSHLRNFKSTSSLF